MKVTVDPDRCIASGACVLASHEVFDQDEDGIVVVLIEEPQSELAASVRDAAAACPAMVIEIEE
ncbi:ferredoxin [Nocardioides sp. J9]|uniref:ferredoxin n=1 Tax=Nocardioides sp. J9 TaxID=935844 RepID=UPI0011AA9792|nr:ferredoxin [Nocardioides sp. J9]TWG98571.1 ferredoxin [Nocardioides sp. J9]